MLKASIFKRSQTAHYSNAKLLLSLPLLGIFLMACSATTEDSLGTQAVSAYYVSSVNGDDADDGTSPETAWKTVGHALETVEGSNLPLRLERGSTFREVLTIDRGGSEQQPWTVEDYGTGERPRITGSDIMAGWRQSSGQAGTYKVSLAINPPTVWQGDDALEKGTYGSLQANQYVYRSGKLIVYTDGNAPQNIEASQRYHIVHDEIGFDHVTLRNLIIERAAAGGINAKYRASIEARNGSDDWTLEDLVVRHGAGNGVFGESNENPEKGRSGIGSNLTVLRVESYGHARRGAVAANNQATNQVFKDVDFRDNTEDGLLINSSGGTVMDSRLNGNGYGSGPALKHGIYMYPFNGGAKNWKIENNVFTANRDSGARITGTDNVFKDNTVSNSPDGIFVVDLDGPNERNQVIGNRFEDTDENRLGIEVNGSVDLLIEDNVFVRSAGIQLVKGEGDRVCKDVVFRGNDLSVKRNAALVHVLPGQGEGFEASDNTYRAVSEGTRWRWLGAGGGFEAWKQASGQDLDSTYTQLD